MAGAPVDSPDRSGSTLDAATRRRLIAAVQREIARASGDALARGVSRAELAAQLDRRIVRLRALAADLPIDEP